jgi:hydroxyacylglutathione hydrolase
MADVLAPEEVVQLAREQRAVLVDLREPAAFGEGHPRGAISARYDARNLGHRVSQVVPEGAAVVLLSDDAGQADDAAGQLEGAFRVLGRATPNAEAWRAAGVEWAALPSVESGVLAGAERERYHLVDVREPIEWEVGYVPGAQLIALGELRQRFNELPRDREVAVICESGARSATAASLLQAAGFTRVSNVIDGTAGYRRAGHPLQMTTAEGGAA